MGIFRKLFIPLFALAGIGFSIFMIFFSAKKPPVNPILFAPPRSPYEHYVAGEGIVEAASKNIPIGAAFPDLVSDVYVAVGQKVQKGEPLFKLDTRRLQAVLQEKINRQEFVRIDYLNKKNQFSYYQRLKDKSATSEQEFAKAKFDMILARQALEVAIAETNVTKTDLERSIIRAPVKGQVLQINVEVGQYANINPFTKVPLMLFGDTDKYNLRIDVDEEDSWRIIMGAPATAFVRGNAKIEIPLKFVYYEPYITPKVTLSGADVERVDTRVIQLVYEFPSDKYPVFAGEQLDVYIEAKPNEARL
jgi:multidrug efflux pump subunit AcrA (membrane-fusion protein)